MLPQNILYAAGREVLRPLPVPLRAGPLTVLFEPQSTQLRHIRLGEHEVLRGIYGAVRDQDWATIPSDISDWRFDVLEDSFRLSFNITCRQREIDYFWRGTITGAATGQITYTFDGQARSWFLRNRIGLCVLHPIAECAGRPCTVEHTDGSRESGAFPRAISPHQPFFDLRAITHGVAGVRAEVRFEGDVFEMEDQRNWTDASFKTYSTPLALPKPVPVEPGQTVRQSVTLTLKGAVAPGLAALPERAPELAVAASVLPLLPIGLGMAGHGRPLSRREGERLKALRLSHLRADLHLRSARFPELLRQAVGEAAQLNTALHLALTLSDNADAELRALTRELDRLRPPVALWLVFHENEICTSAETVRRAREALESYTPLAPFAGGTAKFFAELNRNRPPPDAPFFPCYSMNPQVHQFDNTTLVENLAGQADTVETAREFSTRPVVISPITLRIRAPRLAAAEASPAAGTEPPPDVDPRQMSLLGAGWTLGSIARLAATGNVHSLTYFETTGWRGVMETDAGSPLPEKFPSEPGMVFPVYHILADIGEFAGKQIHPTQSSHPLLVAGLTLLDTRGRRRILVANLSGEVQNVKINIGTGRAQIRFLDETTAGEALGQPERFRARAGQTAGAVGGVLMVRLLPYALARIDIL